MQAYLPEPSLGVLNDAADRLPKENALKCSEIQSHLRAILTPRNMSIYLVSFFLRKPLHKWADSERHRRLNVLNFAEVRIG